MINPEWAGVPAAVLVLISYLFKNQLKLRIINLFACVSFIVYGILIAVSSKWTSGYSTIILNSLCVIVHLYFIIKFKKEKENKEKKSVEITSTENNDQTENS